MDDYVTVIEKYLYPYYSLSINQFLTRNHFHPSQF